MLSRCCWPSANAGTRWQLRSTSAGQRNQMHLSDLSVQTFLYWESTPWNLQQGKVPGARTTRPRGIQDVLLDSPWTLAQWGWHLHGICPRHEHSRKGGRQQIQGHRSVPIARCCSGWCEDWLNCFHAEGHMLYNWCEVEHGSRIDLPWKARHSVLRMCRSQDLEDLGMNEFRRYRVEGEP